MSTVLFLCPYVPHPATHGGSMRSRVLLQALLEHHDVHLAAAVAGDEDRANLAVLAGELGLRTHAVPAVASPRAQLAHKLAHWLRGRSELLSRRWQPGASAAVAAVQRGHAFDLVVLDSTFVVPVWRGTAPRTLLHLHNLEHAALARANGGDTSLSARITRAVEVGRMRVCEREALGRAQLTITVSAPDRQQALTLRPDANVVVVPNSVDVERLQLLPAAPAGGPRLLFVGAFDYPPNAEAAIELVEQHLPVLRRAFPAIAVRLVGRDPQGRLARLRGVAGVEVVGAVEDLQPHYRQSHAVYLPIRSGGGTRIKILEAWALGRPVMSTAVGAEGLEGRESEHWQRFETPAAGALALQQVVAGRTAAMVSQARALVEQRYSHRAAIAALRQHVAALMA